MHIGGKIKNWLTGCREAAIGLVLATRNPKFWLVFLLSFCIFGTLLNLLNAGPAALNLFWATEFGGKLRIIGDAFLANFGIGRTFLDFLLNFVITILQSLLLASIYVVWRKNRALKIGQPTPQSSDATPAKANSTKSTKTASSKPAKPTKSTNSISAKPTSSKLSKPAKSTSPSFSIAGITAGLVVLGAGCPTCGTTIITPVIVAFVSTGGYALAGVISGLLTTIAIILVLFALRRTGLDYYNLATGRLACRIPAAHSKKRGKHDS